MIMGICGEAGELLDAIKKYTIYRGKLDRENVVEELGDLEFYMAGLRHHLGITRERCLRHNMDKLNVRYDVGTFTNEHATIRKDKNDPKNKVTN
jgi:NTP pyrophosphatase (non-canonical NTP hydrolase)